MARRIFLTLVSLGLLVVMVVGWGTVPQETAPVAAQVLTESKPAPVTANSKETKYPLTIQDGAGRSVTIPAEPKRIVSIAPSNTELLFAFGKQASLIGRTDFCDYPAAAKQIQSIGGFEPNLELIISLKPDLILVMGGGVPFRDQLVNDHKLNVFVVDPQNFEQLYAGIAALGQVVNARDQADRVVGDLKQIVGEITAKVATASARPKVFYEVWHDPLMTTGTGTFIDDMIKMAGGVNAAADTTGWASYSLEQLAAKNPDILITSFDQAPLMKDRKGWEGLKAVKDGRVYAVADADTISRPGPRLAVGLKWFAETIHPELFKN